MFELLGTLYHFDKSLLLFITDCIALPIKAYILFVVIREGYTSGKIPKPWIFLCIILLGGIFEDIAWLIKIFRTSFVPTLDLRIQIFVLRLSWGLLVIQYQALCLLITSLFKRDYKISVAQQFLVGISLVCSCFFFIKSIWSFNITEFSERYIEIKLIQYLIPYITSLVLITLVPSFVKLKRTNLPKILKKQLTLILYGIILPHFLFACAQSIPVPFTHTFSIVADHIDYYILATLQSIFLTYGIGFCIKKIMRLRFLNFKKHVQSPKQLMPINNFRALLEQLGQVNELNELVHITKLFFKESFGIPLGRTHLYIRQLQTNTPNTNTQLSHINRTIENFLSESEQYTQALDYLTVNKILIKDEIEFNNFYHHNPSNQYLIDFLQQIDADIFVPIYQQQHIIACLYIEPQARSKQLYNDLERDEFIVFASYLGNIIHLLQNRNLELLLAREKQLEEELYQKHQENNQYRESIRSFTKDSSHNKFGIIFYKNRRFTLGNPIAKEFININLNLQKGHPLTKACLEVASRVEEYNSSYSITTTNDAGQKIVLNGIPNTESNNTIIIAHYPQVSDIIKSQLDILKDPSHWDYLLYLKTTQSGKLVDKLLPGTSETILNFKIALLKLALGKQTILLKMPDDDLLPTVEILHHISLREHLHVLDLQTTTKSAELSIKLFGMNTLFGEKLEEPLLQKLNNDGTLFIKNIHLLDNENQQKITHYIKYGSYTPYRSDKTIASDVRIICSTNQDLTALIQQDKFSRQLYNELHQTTISLPSLLTFQEEELLELTDNVIEQAIKTKEFHTLFELSETEKKKIVNSKPVSIAELRQKIQHILILKSQKNSVSHETLIDPSYQTADPQLIRAAKLGKNALRDPQLMALLWNKFKNQNKIATFLGVNRSSVNRRCKLYNLD